MDVVIKVKMLYKNYKVKTSSKFFSVKYKTIEALKNINFQVRNNECLGILGPNGSGKTTLLKILSGILYHNQGSVNVLGYKPFMRKNQFLKQIGFFMGGRTQLIWDLPAIESLKLSPYIYDYPIKQFYERIDMFKSYLNIKDEINQPIRNMSLGQKMKMELMYSFLHLPKIVFLDEPTIGLDFITQKSLRDFIKLCNTTLNMTFIISSHNLKDILDCCDRTLVINKGEIIYDDEVNNLKNYYNREIKKVTIIFRDISDAEKIAKKYSMKSDKNYVYMNISTGKLKIIIGEILQKYDVQDIRIEEDLEDVIISMIKS